MRTPLFDKHVALGARMMNFHGWEMPLEYSGILPEHRAVRSTAAVFDLCHMGRIVVKGESRSDFLDALLTRAVSDLKPGAARYSLLCNEAGGVLEDLLVYADQDQHMLVVNASNRDKVLKWFAEHSIPNAAQNTGRAPDVGGAFEDKTSDIAMLALQGPAAQDILQPLADADLTAIKRYRFARCKICGLPAVLSRTGYTGEDGFEIYLDREAVAQVFDALLKAGVPPAGLGARDTLRLEAGMCLYGHELTPDINPYEADLAWAVTLDSRKFVGSDSLRTLSAVAPARKRVGLIAQGKRIPREGCRILDGAPRIRGDRDAGFVTSGTFSPTLEKNIAMGYVAASVSATGTPLNIDIRDVRVPAQVAPLPFYTPAKK